MAGSVSTDVVRAALLGKWQAHAAPGGVLVNVITLDEPPIRYDDLYSNARGTLDMIWIDETTATVEVTAFGNGGLELTESVTHTIAIQVDRQASDQTQAIVDTRAATLLEHVIGIVAGDVTLGIDLTDYRSLVVTPRSWTYRRRILDSGGRTPGHSAAYVLQLQCSASSKFLAPALP